MKTRKSHIVFCIFFAVFYTLFSKLVLHYSWLHAVVAGVLTSIFATVLAYYLDKWAARQVKKG